MHSEILENLAGYKGHGKSVHAESVVSKICRNNICTKPPRAGGHRELEQAWNCNLRKDVISVGGNMGPKYGKEVLKSERSFMSSQEAW